MEICHWEGHGPGGNQQRQPEEVWKKEQTNDLPLLLDRSI